MITPNSRALHMAHYLYKNRPDYQWSDMLRRAWYFVRFQDELSRSVIRFSFFKKDGSIREAVGTTNLLLIPDERKPKGAVDYGVECYSAVAFFDLQKSEWRSFSILHFIGFVDIWRIEHVDKPVLKREK